MLKDSFLRFYKGLLKIILYNNYKLSYNFNYEAISFKDYFYFLEPLIFLLLVLCYADQIEFYPFNSFYFYLIFFFIAFFMAYLINQQGDGRDFFKRYLRLSGASFSDATILASFTHLIFPFLRTIFLSFYHNTKILYEYDKLLGHKSTFYYIFCLVFCVVYFFSLNISMAIASWVVKSQHKSFSQK